MNREAIVFRQAELTDIKIIWQLLHADCHMKNEAYIREHLQRIYLLSEGKRVLGALCGIPRTRKAEICWVIVHPLYPETAIAGIMIREFQNIYCRYYEETTRDLRLLTCIPKITG